MKTNDLKVHEYGAHREVGKAYSAMHSFKKVIFKEMNLRIQFLFFFTIMYFANIFQISKAEWLVLILTFTLAITLEMLKILAVEFAVMHSANNSQHVKSVREIGEATLLLASVSLLVVLAIIFIPYMSF